jgi:hypothetical protein
VRIESELVLENAGAVPEQRLLDDDARQPSATGESETLQERRRRWCLDVYVRLGEAEGWGRQPFWTHFDGYLIRTVNGQLRLQALAGGDVRFGGLYDLLGVGRDYDSDHLLARFAVVQRARMVAW